MAPQNNDHLFGPLRTIGIAAPAGPCSRKALKESVRFLRSCGIRTVSGSHLFRKGTLPYLSADDEFRAEDFNSLLEQEQIDAILCTRGGYGTPRILDRINYDLLRERNLPVIGFSDITALHLAMYARNAGVCIASQMAARLPAAMENRITRAGIKRVYASLSAGTGTFRKIGKRLTEVSAFCSDAAGKVIPLNLTLASALCGTEYLPSMQGNIVILEEIGEPVRKIDRMLQQLLLSGFFNGAAAVVFAQFTDCEGPRERNLLFRDFASRLECPVFSGLEYGHELPSLSFRFGEPCRIIDGNFQLCF